MRVPNLHMLAYKHNFSCVKGGCFKKIMLIPMNVSFFEPRNEALCFFEMTVYMFFYFFS
jgi:hypothetical protein